MKPFFSLFIFSLLLLSCNKETDSKQLNEYYKLKVNGQGTSFGPGNAFTGGQFECAYLKDTALFIAVKYGFESAGFYIKAKNIGDGTYTLDKTNQAWYSNPKDFKNYTTNDTYRGTLTINKGVFQSYGSIPTLKGQFSFEAADTTTGNIINITSGQFLMVRHMY